MTRGCVWYVCCTGSDRAGGNSGLSGLQPPCPSKMHRIETGFADPLTLDFHGGRTHRTDKLIYDRHHEVALRFGHRRKSEAGWLPQAVLPAGAGDDTVKGL